MRYIMKPLEKILIKDKFRGKKIHASELALSLAENCYEISNVLRSKIQCFEARCEVSKFEKEIVALSDKVLNTNALLQHKTKLL